ncbi:MAG: DNA-binding protein WhiA [Clostridia bacterium]|nr:DNA-binding protein WhiA [Clostridia bacterium]
MSFSTDIKEELAHISLDKKCCMLAEIAGFVRVCGSVRIRSGKMTPIIVLDNLEVAAHFQEIFREYYGVAMEMEITPGTSLRKGNLYQMEVVDPEGQMGEKILRETGILMVREGFDTLTDGIYEGLVKTKCCKKSYLRGAFLGAGTVSNPEKGYHLEFVLNTEVLARDLVKLINSFVDLHAKVTQRKNRWVVYVKESEQIIDILNIVGAHGHLLKYEEIRLARDLRNSANRLKNCDDANTDKIVNTAQRQLQAIRIIEEKRGLSFLPEKLHEMALLRKEYPEMGLAELGEQMEPPLKKSGVNHRLKKIEEIAAQIQEKSK